jgi:hypothetical protein
MNQPKAPRYVVYHIRSTMERKRFYHKHPARELAAKLGPEYAWHDIEHYETKVVHMVTRINLMSKKEYQEPSNTPGYMSPASEAYWSM